MKSLKKALLATLLVAGIAVAAHAQAPTMSADVPTAKLEKPITVKLGAFFPQSRSAKNAGDVWFMAGASYDVIKTKMESPIIIGAFLDYSFASKNKDGKKYERSFFMVGPQAKYIFNTANASVLPYAGLGAGVSFVHGKDGDSSTSRTRFGWKVFGGVEFKQGFLGEVSYHFPGNVRDGNLDGLGLSLGYRF